MSRENMEFLFLGIAHLIIVSIVAVIPLIRYFIRARKYWRPPLLESREKMKFVTKLSKEEVIEGLRNHKTNDIFEYAFRSESDNVFILSVKGIDQFKLACEGNATYKIVITSEAENTVVWVVLIESANRNAIERYGFEMKGFMEKKILAVRVE
ncbi:MAG: hypothetical protein NC302_11085 [Bacteroidales bacterium]|nr:hypothetical protein [Bacteroidales bacterium]MCM1415284.1 hypothetical protein [bacterium]MCM1424450.1 hypothetical protein [bacterium]